MAVVNRSQRNAGLRGQRTGNRPRARHPQGIYDPTQALTGGSLKRAAGALTDLEIRPQISQLARQIAATNRQGQQVQDRTAGYFRDLGVQARQAYQNQQGVSTRLNSTLQGIGSQAQQQIGAAGETALSQLQPLQQAGLAGDSMARLAAEIAAQRGLSAQNAQTAQTFGARQGANFEGLTASQMGTGALRGQERLGEIANATLLGTQEARGKTADLLASRGQLFTKNLGALRDSERNYQLAADTLGANVQNNLLDAANQRASLRQRGRQFNIQTAQRDQQFQLDYAKYGLDVARDNYQRSHGLGPYKPGSGRVRTLTSSQRNAAFSNIDSAASVAREMLANGNGTGYVRTALAKGYYEVPDTDARGNPTTKRISIPRVGDRALVNAALDLAVLGHLSPANVRSLHRYGLQIGGRYRYVRANGDPGRAVSQGGSAYRGL